MKIYLGIVGSKKVQLMQHYDRTTIREEPIPDADEWKCATVSKRCVGQDPCYFNTEPERCPLYKFKIKTKKVGV